MASVSAYATRQECLNTFLANEEQLTILRKRPKLVSHDKLKLIYLIADFLHLWSNRVVIGNSLEMLISNLVSHLASVDKLLYTCFYQLCALGNLLNDFLLRDVSFEAWSAGKMSYMLCTFLASWL